VVSLHKIEDRQDCFRQVKFGCFRPRASRRNLNLARFSVRSDPTRKTFTCVRNYSAWTSGVLLGSKSCVPVVHPAAGNHRPGKKNYQQQINLVGLNQLFMANQDSTHLAWKERKKQKDHECQLLIRRISRLVKPSKSTWLVWSEERNRGNWPPSKCQTATLERAYLPRRQYQLSCKYIRRIIRTARTTRRTKYFDYLVFNIIDCGLPRSGACHRALAQTIGNARGLDINSPRSAENHSQGLRFHRHQQHDDPNNARGLGNNFASDRGCDSTTSTRLPLYPQLQQQLD
jgi:hypothetical protein